MGKQPLADASLVEIAEYTEGSLPGIIRDAKVCAGQLTLDCDPGGIVRLLTFLRDDANSLFKQLLDIAGVDWPERDRRFDVIYNLLSLSHNQRVRVRVRTDEETPVPSVAAVFKSASWYEREAWDLFGIRFSDHPDLRRILTDYGFEGHPMRKDFPLTGHVEVRYDEEQKRVIYEPVKLTQEFRTFEFMSPWEGAERILSDQRTDESGRHGDS